MRIDRHAPSRPGSPTALAVAACAVALMAAFGAAWQGASRTSAAPTSARGEAQGPFIKAAGTDSTAPAGSQAPDSPSAEAAAQIQPAPQVPNARASTSRPTRATVPGEKGLVLFAVAPWGEVFVNGAREGTTPPLAQLQLPAGRHTIELRNGQRQPYVAQIDVAPGRPLRISHLFQ